MKKILKVLFAIVVFCSLAIVTPVSAKAAKLVKLDQNKTYKTYDFTRDGRKDKFKYTNNPKTCTGRVYINGKCVLESGASRGIYCSYYQVNKKKIYLILESHYAGGGNCVELYYYKNKKLLEVPGKIFGIYADYVKKVKGNTLYIVSYGKFIRSLEQNSLLDTGFISTYKVSDSKIVATSKFAAAEGKTTYYGLNNFYTSKSLNHLSVKDGPRVIKGQKVKLKKVAFVSKGLAFLINVNGRDGWFLNSEKCRLSVNAKTQKKREVEGSYCR